MTRDEFIGAVETAMAGSPADETEIIAVSTAGGLTRVANSQIHQSVAETNSAIAVRAVLDGRVGTARTNRPEPEALARAVNSAVANAKVSPQMTDWPGLPKNVVTRSEKIAAATSECAPGKRAELVGEALNVAKNKKLTMAGALETGVSELYVANDKSGVSRWAESEVNINLVLISLDSSGYASWVGRDLNELDAAGLAGAAAKKAILARKPEALSPGAYTVILEPAAVADMLAFLGYVGLGALSVQEKHSFMADRFGEKLVDEKITFWDDGADPRTLGPVFDY